MTDKDTDKASTDSLEAVTGPKPGTTPNGDLGAATVLGTEDSMTVSAPGSEPEPRLASTTIDMEALVLLGKYEIRKKLGAGAMGAVYLAFDPMIEREVAVKVLPPEVAARPQALDRFLTEARATGKLNHPNIVAIYDIGTQDDKHFIVMEVLRGGSVLDLVESSGALPWKDACRMIADAADGLAAAHAAGLFHRDIKPENLMLTAEGIVKIVDFGLAKLQDTRDESQLAVTQAGQVMGTPQFMSPEQFDGKKVDRRCDIYSLGGTLYQLLTGRFPYEDAKTIVQLMYSHLHDPPPDPTVFSADIPSGCRDVIARAMAKVPDDRYQDAAEFARDLRGLISDGPVKPVASGPSTIEEDWRTLESVCIVEPSRMQALMLKDFLTRSGVASIQVHDKAADATGDGSSGADVVITSMYVPDLSGVDLIAKMRADQRFLRSMLILNSSDSTIDDLIDAGQTGALALVSKKTKPEDILRAVHACSFLNAPSVSFDKPIDPFSLRVLIVIDGQQLPDAIEQLVRDAGLLDIQITTQIDLAARSGPTGKFDLAVLLRTAGDAVDDTKLYAGLLAQLFRLETTDVQAAAAVQIDGDNALLRALSRGGFTAVTRVALDKTRLIRILQITS